MKNNKGVTLIVLILTIIILLILLLVSLNLAINEDLFGKAEKTIEKTNSKIIQDQNTQDSVIKNWDETTGTTIKTETKVPTCKNHSYGNWQITTATCTTAETKTRECSVCGTIQTRTNGIAIGHSFVDGFCTRCGIEKVFKIGIAAFEKTLYTDKNGSTAQIPTGFAVSGIESEQTVSTGLVIYKIPETTIIDDWTADSNDDGVYDIQEQYDQFVWIPVSNVNSMFICQAKTEDTECNITLVNGTTPTCSVHNSTAMAGRLYATTTGENFEKTLTTQIYSSDSGLREPAKVYFKDYSLGIYQADYNNIVKSVILNNGFWIGRYETTGMINDDAATGENLKIRAGQSDGRSI